MKLRRKYLGWLTICIGILCLAKSAYVPTKGMIAEILMERAWVQSQKQGMAVLPWSWMDAKPLARLSVPRLDENEILLDVSTGQALAFAPSHMQQTPRPGQPGVSVIAAHKNTHFAFLKHIKTEDIIEIENIDRSVMTFKVTNTEIVDKNNSGISWDNQDTSAKIALVTCYPFSALSYGGPLRYVVYAEKV